MKPYKMLEVTHLLQNKKSVYYKPYQTKMNNFCYLKVLKASHKLYPVISKDICIIISLAKFVSLVKKVYFEKAYQSPFMDSLS